MNNSVKILYIMGVSGCGKSTVGKILAGRLDLPFFDGDDYHPENNISKMRAGIPLDDSDRKGWLENLNNLASENIETGAVIACSALKKSYREILVRDLWNNYTFIYLKGSFEEIAGRLNKRSNHFMPPKLLQSQFNTLEEPEEGITVPIGRTPEEIVSEILTFLNSEH